MEEEVLAVRFRADEGGAKKIEGQATMDDGIAQKTMENYRKTKKNIENLGKWLIMAIRQRFKHS